MNNYHDFNSLKEMHVEVTSRCNAACPMCDRNINGGKTREDLVLSEWSVEDAHKIFDTRFKNLRNILFCGTHGDPAVAKYSLEIIEDLKVRFPKTTVEFYSNGSVRDPQWWSALGRTMSTRVNDDHYRKSDIAIFSIDGLSDTNHLYRRKTNFEKIMENASAFINAGGHARWDFLVFKHNEHQVEEAKALAKKIGFKHFRVRKTSRFAYSPEGLGRWPVMDNDKNVEYYLEPPTEISYQNKSNTELKSFLGDLESQEVSKIKKINCLYRDEFKRIYVNSRFQVHPCCFMSSSTFFKRGKISLDIFAQTTDRFGENYNSLKEHTWDEILEHSWFKSELVKSWENASQSLLQCQKTCGQTVSPILSQTDEHSITP